MLDPRVDVPHIQQMGNTWLCNRNEPYVPRCHDVGQYQSVLKSTINAMYDVSIFILMYHC